MRWIYLAALLVLLGCRDPTQEGRVYSRTYYPQREVESTVWVRCSDDISIPITSSRTVPARYRIGVEAISGGKVRRREVDVDPITYLSVKEGDWVHLGDPAQMEVVKAEKEDAP